MRFDTQKASQFRRLHASEAVQLVSHWLRSLFAAGTEAGDALRCLIMQLSAQRASFHTACRRAVEFPSHSLLRKWWLQWRHSRSLAEWEALLDAALRAPWERVLRGERVWIILDWHSVPYWGRVTRALEPITTRLVERVQRLGCVALGWIMDKGFYSAGVVALLREQHQPYLIAAPRRGEKQGIAALLAQLEAKHGFQEAPPPPLQRDYVITPRDKSLAPQPTTVIIGWEPVAAPAAKRRQRPLRRSQTKPGQRWRAFAWVSGGRNWTTRKAQRAYAPRTGFESGYRLSKGCRGRTSSRDAGWRLFLFGMSLLLQNAWIWLVIGGKRTLHRCWEVLRDFLPFTDFCAWLVHCLEAETGHRLIVDLPGV